MSRLRVDFITNQAPHYRAALWDRILEDTSLDPHFLYGEGATSSIRPIDLSEPRWREKRERFYPLHNVYFRKVLVWQRGVLGHVRRTDAGALVLLGQMYIISMWLGALKARRRGIRILFWGHGAYGREGRIKKWIRKRFLGLADGVMVYGSHARDLLISDGFDPDKVFVVYNSLDQERQKALRDKVIDNKFFERKNWFSDSSAPTLIFVGRLTKQKSLELLIKAVGELECRGRRLNLLFVGDGPQRQSLEGLCSKMGRQIHFYGACYEETELAPLIANSDLCVSPGEIGLTAMHALGYGTPVCTHSDMSRQGPEAEAVVDASTGVLFDRQEMNICEAIERWFDSAPCRETVREACLREIDEKWNTANQALRISDAILSVRRGR